MRQCKRKPKVTDRGTSVVWGRRLTGAYPEHRGKEGHSNSWDPEAQQPYRGRGRSWKYR